MIPRPSLPVLFSASLRALFGIAFLATAALFPASSPARASEAPTPPERPHLILIMIDDMGFSDVGWHGSEIETPHLDALALGGACFSQFYNSGRCCPTRASLLTGLHPHETSIGHMTEASEREILPRETEPPAYQGYLNRECLTLAEAFKESRRELYDLSGDRAEVNDLASASASASASAAAPSPTPASSVEGPAAIDGEKVAMRTPWGEEVTPENVWQEYPRPQMQREDWTNLNGLWDFAVVPQDREEAPESWDGEILVPFAIEAPLSGVEERVGPEDALWYRRSLSVEKREGRRYRLNFEAVDYESAAWVNGERVGRNTGGNLPFSFDVTEALRDGENEILVRITDQTDARGAYQLHGKQVRDPRGIWYTPVTGIWQTVWMEEVPDVHLVEMHLSAFIDGRVEMRLGVNHSALGQQAIARAFLDGREVAFGGGGLNDLVLQIPEPRLWSPDSPTLYELEIRVGEDRVRSYVGLRHTEVVRGPDGHLRFALNGEILFHWGVLDQGWWPDGLLTPPSDEAMVSEIEFLKEAGFNTIRKHIKVEPRRYYWHTDRLGMLVWQDQVSSGSGQHRGEGESSPAWTRLQPDPPEAEWPDPARRQFFIELKKMVDTLHNHPSIVQWVPFNEAWGQHDSVEIGEWLVAYDPNRQVNIASGGNWFPVGHVVDHHQYPHPAFPFELGEGGRFDGYVKAVGEFGGHGFPVEGHLWDPGARNWGYGGLPENEDEWRERYFESIRLLAELKEQGVAAGIYTQTSDVEGEINGLLTYDRRVRKISAAELREVARTLVE